MREHGVGPPEDSRDRERGERTKGRRREGRKPKKVGWHWKAEVGYGRWCPVPRFPSALVWGRVSVHFVFLHTV